MGFLDNIFSKYSPGEKKIMAQNEELIESLKVAKDNIAEVSGKVDKLVAALGQVGTPEQRAEITALVKEVQVGIQAAEDKLDAVPVPEEPPVDPSDPTARQRGR